MDDHFEGKPVQYRELMNNESKLFLSLFPNFHTIAGGTETGFNNVKPEEYRTRLLSVKGNNKTTIVREVPKTYKSLNAGDVFILDAGLNIYQWNGSTANVWEKNKAQQIISGLVSDRSGKPKHTVLR